MKYKCIHCGNRSLQEKYYDGELHCSHAKCDSCGADLIVWYDKDENEVTLIEEEPDAVYFNL